MCEDLNVLGFTVITPPPSLLHTGTVSLEFGGLAEGESFAAIIRLVCRIWGQGCKSMSHFGGVF